MLRRTLVAFAGAIALMGGAFAAEPLPPPYLPPYLPPAPYLPPPFSWDGFYIGVTAGFDPFRHHCDNLNGLDVLPETSVACSDLFRSYGFIGGGTLGYTWQKGSFVYGLETDFSGATNSTSTSLSVPGACTPGTFQFEPAKCGFGWKFSNSVHWLWTVRPRIGLAVDRTLVYFTAGFALGGVQNSAWSTGSCGPGGCNLDEPFFAVTDGKTAVGYAAGGGVEYALTPNWSIKGEALYVNFESRTATFFTFLGSGSTITPNGPFNIRWDNSLVLVRAGLNYRFNWAPIPVVAKY